MSVVKGQNWGVFGMMNTGKTHQTLDVALKLQKKTGKRIIIFDHSSNESYDKFKNIIPIDYLQYQLPQNVVYKVQSDDIDTFCQYAVHFLRNSILVIDDSGIFFSAGFPKNRERFIKSAKNNGLDIFYQVHSFREIGPALLENLHMILLKEISNKEIDNRLPWKTKIQWLHEEIVEENNKRPKDQLWSYRIYNVYEDVVFIDDGKGGFKAFQGRDYFKKYEKKSKK